MDTPKVVLISSQPKPKEGKEYKNQWAQEGLISRTFIKKVIESGRNPVNYVKEFNKKYI